MLLVKSEAGTATQFTDNRPLILADKYLSMVDSSITYMLLSTEDSTLVDADTVTAVAVAAGEIGKEPTDLAHDPRFASRRQFVGPTHVARRVSHAPARSPGLVIAG